MNGRSIVKEARRRAGITQEELAARVGTTQSAIARLEAGVTSPALARVDALVRACGFSLTIELDGAVDPDEWARARRNLALTPDRRLTNAVNAARFVLAGRGARRRLPTP
jgi:hypothetical protein